MKTDISQLVVAFKAQQKRGDQVFLLIQEVQSWEAYPDGHVFSTPNVGGEDDLKEVARALIIALALEGIAAELREDGGCGDGGGYVTFWQSISIPPVNVKTDISQLVVAFKAQQKRGEKIFQLVQAWEAYPNGYIEVMPNVEIEDDLNEVAKALIAALALQGIEAQLGDSGCGDGGSYITLWQNIPIPPVN